MRTIARSKIATGGAILTFAHEALTRRAHERDRLREEHAHGVAERDRLLVRRSGRLQLRKRCAGQLDCRVQRPPRELPPLGFVHRRRLLLRELTESAKEILRIAAERETEAAFHAYSIGTAYPLGSPRGGVGRRRPSFGAGRARPASNGSSQRPLVLRHLRDRLRVVRTTRFAAR